MKERQASRGRSFVGRLFLLDAQQTIPLLILWDESLLVLVSIESAQTSLSGAQDILTSASNLSMVCRKIRDPDHGEESWKLEEVRSQRPLKRSGNGRRDSSGTNFTTSKTQQEVVKICGDLKNLAERMCERMRVVVC